MPKEAIDITPADSAVPVYLEEPTDTEIAERQAQHEVNKAAKAAREIVRESALAKLSALGLTEEEIAILIGGVE
jgi:hypothetical protein